MKKQFYFLAVLFFSIQLNAQQLAFSPLLDTSDFDGFVFNKIKKDSKGQTWILGEKSSVMLMTETDTTIFKTEELGLASGSTDMEDLHEDEKGRIWIATNKGILMYDSSSWTLFYDELEKTFTYNIAEFENEIYFSTRGGCIVYNDTSGWRFDKLGTGNQPAELGTDFSGSIWFCYVNGDPTYRLEEGSWVEYNTSNSEICSDYLYAMETTESRFYFSGAFGGFCAYDGTNFTDLKNVSKIDFIETMAASGVENSLYIAGENFDSFDGAMNIIDFISGDEVQNTYGIDDGLPDEIAKSILVKDDGDLLVIYNESIYISHLVSAVSKKDEVQSPKLLNNLTSDYVYFDNVDASMDLMVLDMAGRILIKETANESLNIAHFENGVYIVNLYKDGSVYNFKVVKN